MRNVLAVHRGELHEIKIIQIKSNEFSLKLSLGIHNTLPSPTATNWRATTEVREQVEAMVAFPKKLYSN